MNLIKPSYEIMSKTLAAELLIEQAGRVCYKSEEAITPESHKIFIKARIRGGHESIIEHASITVKFICDRGVTHELVRHRLVSYSQESTRYCNYSGGVTFIIPPWVQIPPYEYDIGWRRINTSPPIFGVITAIDRKRCELTIASDDPTSERWFWNMAMAERDYIALLKDKWSPQQARSVLPNSLKTEIIATANIREWRHILNLRTSRAAHPQMQELMRPLLIQLSGEHPVFFRDLWEKLQKTLRMEEEDFEEVEKVDRSKIGTGLDVK